MRTYEAVLVIEDVLGQEDIDKLTGELKKLVEKHGATNVEVQPWGRKRLAYEIKKKQFAHYVLFRFSSENNVPHELEQILRIEKHLLRFQVFAIPEDANTAIPTYRNFDRLAELITDRGKIRPGRMTRYNPVQQREVTRQIKRARLLALLPYSTTGGR